MLVFYKPKDATVLLLNAIDDFYSSILKLIISGGPRRVNHAACSVGEAVFSFGGYCTGDNYKDIRPIDIFVLNSVTYRWSSIPKPKSGSKEAETWPFQRYGHSVSAHNGKV